MKLSELAARLKEYGLFVSLSADADFNSITYDSRSVTQGSLFTCKGKLFKKEYLEKAIVEGAYCYLSETEYALDNDIPHIITNDIRRAMSITAIFFYNNPLASMKSTGITGTKGKTTTTFYLTSIYNAFTGRSNGAITTVHIENGKEVEKSVLTTPESFDLQGILSRVRDNGAPFVTMEVSSQGLKVHRVFGMMYDVGIFLNIGDDHISPNEHPDWNDYFESKLKIFGICRYAVVNADADHADEIYTRAKKCPEGAVSYGRTQTADWRLLATRRVTAKECNINVPTTISPDTLVQEFDIVGPSGKKETFAVTMQGAFNVDNALAAIITAKHFGVSDEAITLGLITTHVPGRMDMFYNPRTDVKVVVDFAHNRLSFENLFKSLHDDYPERRLGVFIGSAGGKGFQRRRAIGEMLTIYADYCILTDCDSNNEDTLSICNEIASHIGPNGPKPEIILDREEAITRGLLAAKPGDLIACVARGEETRHWMKGQVLTCVSDTELARMYCDGELEAFAHSRGWL